MRNILVCLLVLSAFIACSQEEAQIVVPSKYYIDSELGNDNNPGDSPSRAWKTLRKIESSTFIPGDEILLANGSVFNGSLILKSQHGTEKAGLLISNYPKNNNKQLPIIDAKGELHGVLIQDCSFIELANIEITGDGDGVVRGENAKNNMRCGVLVNVSTFGTFEHIKLSKLVVRDIFFENAGFNRGKDEVRTPNGVQSYGWGIRVMNQIENATLKNITIENCRVQNVAHTGIKFTGRNKSIADVNVLNNEVNESGGPGMQMSGVKNGWVQGNAVYKSGSDNDSRKWGRGSGLWTWGCDDILIERNSFRKANGPGDSAGCHIDFNCRNVVVQYNISEGNAGGFCEILGNNYNCAYRYNISINDGHRIKGENGAFQEGKIFWLSGFNGKNTPRKGPFNSYFYNNTIYVSKDIVAKVAVDRASSGVLIANNIFYIEGESRAVKGDQYKPETEGESRVEKIVFQNNLYLKGSNWPKDVLIQDSDMLIGDPGFKQAGGLNIVDYVPQNVALIKNKGIVIEPIVEDKVGLTTGLKVEQDILGNPINGLPDLGAIELN